MSLDHDRARQLHAAANNPPAPFPADLRAIAGYFTRRNMPASAAAVLAAADYIEAHNKETAR